jgi:hypothetical protein
MLVLIQKQVTRLAISPDKKYLAAAGYNSVKCDPSSFVFPLDEIFLFTEIDAFFPSWLVLTGCTIFNKPPIRTQSVPYFFILLLPAPRLPFFSCRVRLTDPTVLVSIRLQLSKATPVISPLWRSIAKASGSSRARRTALFGFGILGSFVSSPLYMEPFTKPAY